MQLRNFYFNDKYKGMLLFSFIVIESMRHRVFICFVHAEFHF